MRKVVFRAAVAAAGFVGALSMASAAQATDFSINTSVPGGNAWVIDPPGYLTGTIHDGSHSVTAYIGVIDLKGQLVNDPSHAMADLRVFCIDIGDDLASGTFMERSIAELEDTSSSVNVHYTAQQVSDLTKFLAYASTQNIADPVSSAVAQLGVWEIIAESGDSDWDVTSGNFHVDGLTSAVTDEANSWLAASRLQSSDGYQLHILDPLAGNQVLSFVTRVPEPATWGMIVVGFGLLGSALRRRKPDQLFA